MKLKHVLSTTALLLGGLIAGCKTADAPATAPAVALPAAPTTMPAMPTVALPTTTVPGAKDLTHEVTKDQPLFASEPGPSDAPAGSVKAGSKVLVLIPGVTYSQVVTDTGISAYTATDGLKALGK